MNTILGAGGPIGNALADTLLENGEKVRLFSRSKYEIDGTESVRGDLASYASVLEVLKDTKIAYLCAGLKYDYRIWQEEWPKIIRNTINACKETGTKLVFFDNVYMYGKVDGKMTEDTPHNPISKKGLIRSEIARLLENEMQKNDIEVIIARAADLYGPYSNPETSIPYMMVFKNLMRGKRARWMADLDQPHSFTYIPDCAKGLYMLANDEEAWNQIWHLPTHSAAIDGKTFIAFAAKELGVEANYSVLRKKIFKIGKLFSKMAAEAYEMLYQNEFPYLFDSTKFNKHFNYKPQNYRQGIKETIKYIKKKEK